MDTLKPDIWVIDDEAPMRILLRDFLVTLGHEVRGFASAVEALAALEKKELPAAMIAHIRIAPMSGLNFLRIAKRDHPELPILLFTGAEDAGERKEAMRLQAYCYLVKPFLLTDLKDKIEMALSAPKKAIPQANS